MYMHTDSTTEKGCCLANKNILSMTNLSKSQFSTGSYDGTFFYQALYATNATAESRQIFGFTQVNLPYDIV